jgi:large subunit ribosomal protein L32
MAQPKRKQSKARSRKRRGANRFKAPQVVLDPTDNSPFLPHRVNESTGMYRGRQVKEPKEA